MTGRTRLLRKLVPVLVPSEPTLESDSRVEVEDAVVQFVAAQIGSLPTFIRLPYGLALIGFDWLALARYGRRYVSLDDAQCRQYLSAWDTAPLGLFRDFVKLLRSCALLAYMDHPIVSKQLEVMAGLEPAP